MVTQLKTTPVYISNQINLFLKFRFIVGHVCSYVEPLYHSSNVIPVTKCCTVL